MVDTGDFLSKALLISSAVAAVILGLKTFNVNLIESFLPDKVDLIYRIMGGIGAYTIYTMVTNK